MIQEKINDALYFPMLVSEEGNTERMASVASVAIWEKFHALAQDKQDVLVAREMPFKVKTLQATFHLNDNVVGQISLMVREIFFGELSLAECEAKIGSMLMQMGGGDPNQARAITEFIQKEILTIQPKPDAEETEAPVQAVTASLPLLQALSKYENLGNQLITEDRIRIKSQPDPVRPSLLYWLKYYRDELGVGHHDNVQRGGFLFRSENGKKLSAQERERINLILKSVEENFPLAIDTERQEIAFPAFQGVLMGEQRESPPAPLNPSQGARPVTGAASAPAEARQEAPTDYATGGLRIGRSVSPGASAERAPRSAEIGSVNFSTAHVFPAEREAAENRPVLSRPQTPPPMLRPAEVPRSAPQFVPPPAPKRAVQQPNPFRIDPVSLGTDERDE